MDSLRYRLPPQNIEAEASLLSATLIDNRILDDVVDVLIPQDFYRTAHQLIYQGMIDLVEKREPIDLVTLTNILKDRGELETIGGAIYLAKLIDEVPLAVNAGHYAKIIHDIGDNKVIKRSCQRASNTGSCPVSTQPSA